MKRVAKPLLALGHLAIFAGAAGFALAQEPATQPPESKSAQPGDLAVAGQEAAIAPERPSGLAFWRPYLPVYVPPAPLGNTPLLQSLIRAGQLYLTAHDAVALALENNIDIETARYTPLDLAWRYERFQAGGALPGVPNAASQASSVASGQGVLGSQAAAGVSINGNLNSSRTTGNATVSQVGPVVATLDPIVQQSDAWSHRTTPQPDPILTIAPVLVQGQRVYTGSYQQGFLTGGSVNMSYTDHFLNENAPTDFLNPSVAPVLSLSFQHNLLQGFGLAVNRRNITVAKINLGMSDLNFKAEVANVVTAVLNAYYAVAAQYDDVKAKQSAMDTARRFLDENRQRLELGSLAAIDVTSARNLLAAAQQALVNSQSALTEQERELKNLISRTGMGDHLISEVQIVPLDHITVPDAELPPLKDLVTKAMTNRPDLLAERENIKGSEISALGTKNGLLPTAQVFTTVSNAGLAGEPRRPGVSQSLIGGTGTALGELARRDYPTESIGVFGTIQIHDRQALADYAIDQLQLRQQQLSTAKDFNQAQVDVTNAVVALQQARARYAAAVQNRILDEQLLDAEEKKFALGASTSYNVILLQRDLAGARASELAASASWESARLYLDSVTGDVFETNGITLEEAKSGRVPVRAVQ